MFKIKTLRNQVRRARAKFWPTNVRTQQLICLCGLKRSGLHAVSFWLLGHEANHALVNNSPAKKPGDSSPMSRTIQTCPLPVLVAPGDQVSICKGGTEESMSCPASVNMLMVLFQSQHLWHLHKHESLIDGVEAVETRHILLLRDPFNWAASFMQKSQSPGDSEIWADQWQEYADEFVGKTSYLPNALKVNYNRWFLDKKYRQSISAQLGLNFTDAGLEVVTQHAGGSSFDQAQYNQRAQQMQVMERWKHFKDDERFVNSFMKRPDIVELAQTLFDLPPELAEFAAYCRR